MRPWKFHPSWWLVAVMTGAGVGVALGYFVWLQITWLIFLLVTVIFIAMIFYTRQTFWPVVICAIFGILLGWWRGSTLKQQIVVYQNLLGKNVVMAGRLSDDVGQTSFGAYSYRLGDITIFGHNLPGDVLVTTRQKTTAKRGDLLEVSGKVSEGISGYQITFKSAEIRQITPQTSFGLNVRNVLTAEIEQNLSPLQASLADAFLTGKRREIPSDFAQKLQIVGLTHLVVASGFHLTVIVRAGKRLSEKRSRKLALGLGILLIIVFSSVAGSSPSMARAGLVSLISLIGWYFGRKAEAWRILLLVFGALVLLNPLFLWGNVAFYLSFSSFAGVLLVGPTLRQYFWGKTKLSFFGQLATEALAAQIMTLPIMMLFFGKISTVAILANLLIVPVAAPVMFFALLVGLLSWLPLVGPILVWLLQNLVNYMIHVINFLAKIPYAQIPIEINVAGAIVVYVVIVGVFGLMAWRNQRDQKLAAALAQFNIIE